MRPLLEGMFGTPQAVIGRERRPKPRSRLRGEVAGLLGCGLDEVVFTSGGSEANNLALKGVYY